MNVSFEPFPSYLEKQPEIDAAWTLVERRFASLPAPLDELGARFLQSIAQGPAGHRSYFSSPLAPPLLYMPLWLAKGLRAEGALPAILAGTMQGYFYIRIQDDALDEPARADREMLLLGNACIAAMFDHYRQALGAHAAFWGAFERAFLLFSQRTLAEGRAVRADGPAPEEHFAEHAEKVAFARVPLLAVAALAEKLELEGSIGSLVNTLGLAYGIMNDALGWPRDLEAGQRTRLLTQAGLGRADLEAVAREAEGAPREAAREALAERLRQQLYEGLLLHRSLEEAILCHRKTAEAAAVVGLPGFEAFTAERIAWIEALDRQVLAATMKRALAPRS